MNIKNILLIAFLILFNINKTNATAQRPDYLIIENDTLKLHCNPLEGYFEKKSITTRFKGFNSGLWRSYIAFLKLLIID